MKDYIDNTNKPGQVYVVPPPKGASIIRNRLDELKEMEEILKDSPNKLLYLMTQKEILEIELTHKEIEIQERKRILFDTIKNLKNEHS